jgi:hypothetical protein
MNKKFILSVLGFFVATMATAYPWHIVLFHEKYVAMGAMTRGEPIVPLGMIAVLLQGVVFSYFYPIYYRHKNGGHPVKRGIEFSLLIGINVWTVMVFATAAKFKIEPIIDFICLGTAFQLIQFIVVGSVIGLIHGRETSLS